MGDEVYLYYGIGVYYDYLEGYYTFESNGRKDAAEYQDYCLAKMKVTGVADGTLTFGQIEDETKTSFSFKNINSVFRQKLTFTTKSGDPVAPNITSVEISSANNKTVLRYYPFKNEPYEYGFIKTWRVLASSGGNIYFSTMFNDENKGDAIVFTAYDSDGKTYSCTKAAPEGGFQNNKYYYGDAVLELKSTLTVDGMVDYSIQSNAENGIDYYIQDEPANVSISGMGSNNFIWFYKGATVTMDNVNATTTTNDPFIYNMNGFALTLNLKGDNYVSGNDIVLDGGGSSNLRLKCAGDQATLTITTDNIGKQYCGFFFKNISFDSMNYDGEIKAKTDTGYADLQAIAADDNGDGTPDYIIQRSAMAENQDGTCTWTFTVTKKSE